MKNYLATWKNGIFEKEEDSAREKCGVVIHTINQRSPDVHTYEDYSIDFQCYFFAWEQIGFQLNYIHQVEALDLCTPYSC